MIQFYGGCCIFPVELYKPTLRKASIVAKCNIFCGLIQNKFNRKITIKTKNVNKTGICLQRPSLSMEVSE